MKKEAEKTTELNMERYRWAKEEFKEAQREKENVKNKKILA
jgi:hypothetical protein